MAKMKDNKNIDLPPDKIAEFCKRDGIRSATPFLKAIAEQSIPIRERFRLNDIAEDDF
jgi:hypothetical protein